MQFLWAIIAGLIIGLLAKLVVPGRQRIPLWLVVIIGIAGGLLGNGISSWIGVRHTSGFDWTRHILQVAVAAVLIAVISPLWARRTARRTAGPTDGRTRTA